MSRFSPAEILDLIAEVGHVLLLCERETTIAANIYYGSPRERSVTSRTIRGYVVPESAKEIQIATDQELRSGGYIAYVSAQNLRREDLTENSFISFENRMYPLEYLQGVGSQGTVLLHKIRLLRPVSTLQQPDAVIDYYANNEANSA